jgi:RNA polymerase subunit RPABC4/transcription elongation factor Spt4
MEESLKFCNCALKTSLSLGWKKLIILIILEKSKSATARSAIEAGFKQHHLVNEHAIALC